MTDEQANTTSNNQPGAVVTQPTAKKVILRPWMIIVVGVLLLAVVIGAVILLMGTGAENVGKIRDIFIIFMALESLLIGAVLIILAVQLAVLTNLIQNEVKPILDSTSETVNTLKGTTVFISKNVTEPIIALNTSLAGLKKFFDVIIPSKK